jgi:hypothetical protein
MEILWLGFIGTPITTIVAWWRWLRRDTSTPHTLRTGLTFMGLLAASTNVLVYYSWLLYRLMTGSNALVWRLKDIFSDIGVPLALLALVGAICGKGNPRITIAVCALLGLLNWVSIGIL